MSTAVAHKSPVSICEVGIRETYGWRRYRSGEITLWLKGALYGLNGESLARRLA